MNIKIMDAEHADPVMLAACIERAKRFYGDCDTYTVTVTINVNKPDSSGEAWMICFPYINSEAKLWVCALRGPGSTEIEFHS